MQELYRIVEDPRRCSYLPAERAALEYRFVGDLEPQEYSELLARGYRRFGHQLFRPACPACSQCVSLRVEVQHFHPTRSQKRAWRRNAAVRAELHPLFLSRQHLELYRLYHQDMTRRRGWRMPQTSAESFSESFLLGGERFGRQWLFWNQDRLAGVAFMDEVPDAVSMVYYFHHPDWRPDSPGTFSTLTQIDYARRKGLKYAYLGYWVEKCGSMAYKSAFRPHQRLQGYPQDGEDPRWEKGG
ncbi:MAG: arginyltransferase [Acidobacteriota bacterium]